MRWKSKPEMKKMTVQTLVQVLKLNHGPAVNYVGCVLSTILIAYSKILYQDR
jgi:hypothetical protein